MYKEFLLVPPFIVNIIEPATTAAPNSLYH